MFISFSCCFEIKYLLLCRIMWTVACQSNHVDNTEVHEVLHVKHFYESGQLKRVYDINADSIKNGQLVNYYPDGRIRQKEYYRNGVKDGFQNTYYPDGTLESRNQYRLGHLNGSYEWHHRNGRLKTNGFRKNDQVEGEVLSFYESGELRSTCFFENDRRKGEQKMFYKNGEVQGLNYFSSLGVRQFEISFGPDGKIVHHSGSPILELELKADSYNRRIKSEMSLAVPKGTVAELRVVRKNSKVTKSS